LLFLVQHGAVLFRGFPITSPDKLNQFVESFGFDNFPYVGGAAVRRQLAPRVFTTNESPPSEKIPFHHEMAQGTVDGHLSETVDGHELSA
jgi:hypothetical protein